MEKRKRKRGRRGGGGGGPERDLDGLADSEKSTATQTTQRVTFLEDAFLTVCARRLHLAVLITICHALGMGTVIDCISKLTGIGHGTHTCNTLYAKELVCR
jgi:hypothetical protein